MSRREAFLTIVTFVIAVIIGIAIGAQSIFRAQL